MIETFMTCLILALPYLITILGGIATVISAINKIRKNSAETKAVVAEAKETVKQIQSSPELREMLAVIVKENATLKKALTLAVEELKHIHELHPEWIEKGE